MSEQPNERHLISVGKKWLADQEWERKRLEAKVEKLREALEDIASIGDFDVVRIARKALGGERGAEYPSDTDPRHSPFVGPQG